VIELNRSHDPARRSWLESANDPATDFPIQNLPFGVFREGGVTRVGIAIGDRIIDLTRARRSELFFGQAAEAASFAAGTILNPLMRLGHSHAGALRTALGDLLDARVDIAHRGRLQLCLIPMSAAEMLLPVEIPAFTDYLCSIDHTLRMGGGKLPPAFKRLPIAYNSRATSVVVSGRDVVRPNGQFKTGMDVEFGPEPWLDFELEMGAFVGIGNDLGVPIDMRDADAGIFGYCLLNDWSARGIQFFESTPLGPFLGKSFSTTISPWVVTAEALAPYRVPAVARDAGDEPPAHLDSSENRALGGIDIELQASIRTPKMRAAGEEPFCVTTTQFRHMYWTFAQMLAHHASNGCNMQTGDLLGSGTTSGDTDESRACLAEITERGTEPVQLPNGEARAWLEDGDEVIFRGYATRSGYPRIGFGECRGRVVAAPTPRGAETGPRLEGSKGSL
jgi:fumarylacetoacetase